LTLQGKGFYIWQIRRCEAGNAGAIANVASQAGLSHVLIKIADGTNPYNIDSATGSDLVPPVVTALHERNIQAWGWHYVYGYEPLKEADIAVLRVKNLGLDGYAIDAEAQYEQSGMDSSARSFMSRLRAGLPTFPVALSSYRYPSVHPNLPWQAFLEKCDLNMPQVYWVEADNPGEQLIRCNREFGAISPSRPIIPTGSAFLQGSWAPTVPQINEFLQTAQVLNLNAANFWEWGHTRLYLPDLWQAVQDYPWPPKPSDQDIVEQYFAAMNAHDPAKVVALYASDAVHVTSDRTLQGSVAIKAWYASLFASQLPNGKFTMTNSTGSLGSRQFTWTATSNAGSVNNGNDSLGLVNNQIVYHYSYFTIV